ncbi:putative cysteine-rich receptor-like protein kinase 12 [Corylus avellana]|uniref:putative cysteine-rich receptor-like protein kinase 12 n=1 Tax=Corylus avellana TaxID=13451 RepID=UPI00286B2E17|nr:putative cysteine-rich receptor-like protein kinase 12 [Corylus avellana]
MTVEAVFSYADIDEATNKFAFENKLGEGGYGPVYKGILANGEEIAVKKHSKASTRGFEEFKNEVTLAAKLQHVNLVRVLGFCIERNEQMLTYEHMPNKSLDFYLFDLARQSRLDWRKRVDIIEGITQGHLYLQEYSRFTIIHRDLKACNILLDIEMKPKISDFGMAKINMKQIQAELLEHVK